LSFSLYEISTPIMVRMLSNLSAILKKGEEFAAEKGIDPATLIDSRLAPDMFPLARQVQIASDTAKGCAARLAGLTAPSFADTETTFAQLRERVTKTIEYLGTVEAGQIDGSEGKEIVLKFPNAELHYSGRDYVLTFVLPNVYFHITTTYALLRQAGVPLGKRDFLAGGS
jgi:hypothetical protein